MLPIQEQNDFLTLSRWRKKGLLKIFLWMSYKGIKCYLKPFRNAARVRRSLEIASSWHTPNHKTWYYYTSPFIIKPLSNNSSHVSAQVSRRELNKSLGEGAKSHFSSSMLFCMSSESSHHTLTHAFGTEKVFSSSHDFFNNNFWNCEISWFKKSSLNLHMSELYCTHCQIQS